MWGVGWMERAMGRRSRPAPHHSQPLSSWSGLSASTTIRPIKSHGSSLSCCFRCSAACFTCSGAIRPSTARAHSISMSQIRRISPITCASLQRRSFRSCIRVMRPRTRYIDSLCGMPAWTNTEAHYFRAGEDMFASMCEELEKAERFIFLEYFIIEEGKMWNTILDILARKAKKGLDVASFTTMSGRSRRCRSTMTAIRCRSAFARSVSTALFRRSIPI